jgi:hypothetical protein
MVDQQKFFMTENPIEKIQYPEIAAELEAMRDADQEMRLKQLEDPEFWIEGLDKKHTERLKEIIQEIGWPSVSKVGEKAAGSAWLLVQHADHDVGFQEECLAMIKELPEGEVEREHLALLTDRTRVNRGQPQIYGTQFYDDIEGNYGPRPIEDPEHLEERRKALGLVPFEEHKNGLFAKYKKTKE